jgi:hypothetical protein
MDKFLKRQVASEKGIERLPLVFCEKEVKEDKGERQREKEESGVVKE